MSKLHIDIDSEKMNQSKERIMNNVMSQIETQERRFNFSDLFTSKRLTASFALVLIIGLFVLFNPNQTQPVKIEAYESEEIARTSYITGSIITMATTDLSFSNSTLVKLSSFMNETDFEENIESFNNFFDMLRVYVDDVEFEQIVALEELTDGEYDYKLSYVLDNTNYVFFLNQSKGHLTGVLMIGMDSYDITGNIKEDDEKIELSITAYNGSDYVKVEYENEINDELEKTYKIEQKKNNQVTTKEIKIETENNETKVEITSENASYEITKKALDVISVYEIEYQLGDTEGEAEIRISINDLGEEVFQYHIEEDDIEVEIELDDPDEDDEDFDEDDDETDEEEGEDESEEAETETEEDETETEEDESEDEESEDESDESDDSSATINL